MNIRMNIIEPIQRLIDQGVESALTIWPEWQFPIVDLPARAPAKPPEGDKGIENRTWPIPAKYIGKKIALHWGAHIGGRKGNEAKHEGCVSMLSMVRRAGWSVRSEVSTPRTPEVTRGGVTVVFDPDKLVLGSIGCVVEVLGLIRPGFRDLAGVLDPYYTGDWGWRFRVIERLATPIPCKGAQGLWPLRSLLGENVGTPRAGRAWS